MTDIEPGFGHLATQALRTALQLRLFHRLAQRPATAAELAAAAHADARAVAMVLDALVGLGQLVRHGERYSLPQPMQAALRCPGVDADELFDATLAHLELLLANWSRLTDVVRSGQPVSRLGRPTEGPEVFTILVRRLFPRNYLLAKQLVAALPKRLRQRPIDLLDVGAGSACWSIPFAEANGRARVVALDFAPVLDVARRFARACGVAKQFAFRAGDLRRVRLRREAFDVALLGHICHSEGEEGSRRLFRKLARALRPHGLMLVADMLADPHRQGNDGGAFALLFALNMLVHTERGGTYTVAEYRTWAKDAGFRSFRRIPLPGSYPILAFRK